ncbi:hypothetical protein B484DRAFT_80679 [Ochromonadaceae sp. CCMP2298]|nr:hypothetical protein B484DRAFT_80679 [Ochromonadaceae sp. CCMP2298]
MRGLMQQLRQQRREQREIPLSLHTGEKSSPQRTEGLRGGEKLRQSEFRGTSRGSRGSRGQGREQSGESGCREQPPPPGPPGPPVLSVSPLLSVPPVLLLSSSHLDRLQSLPHLLLPALVGMGVSVGGGGGGGGSIGVGDMGLGQGMEQCLEQGLGHGLGMGQGQCMAVLAVLDVLDVRSEDKPSCLGLRSLSSLSHLANSSGSGHSINSISNHSGLGRPSALRSMQLPPETVGVGTAEEAGCGYLKGGSGDEGYWGACSEPPTVAPTHPAYPACPTHPAHPTHPAPSPAPCVWDTSVTWEAQALLGRGTFGHAVLMRRWGVGGMGQGVGMGQGQEWDKSKDCPPSPSPPFAVFKVDAAGSSSVMWEALVYTQILQRARLMDAQGGGDRDRERGGDASGTGTSSTDGAGGSSQGPLLRSCARYLLPPTRLLLYRDAAVLQMPQGGCTLVRLLGLLSASTGACTNSRRGRGRVGSGTGSGTGGLGVGLGAGLCGGAGLGSGGGSGGGPVTPLTPPECEWAAAYLGAQMAGALCLLHGVGVLHCDVKTDNWVLTVEHKTQHQQQQDNKTQYQQQQHSKTQHQQRNYEQGQQGHWGRGQGLPPSAPPPCVSVRLIDFGSARSSTYSSSGGGSGGAGPSPSPSHSAEQLLPCLYPPLYPPQHPPLHPHLQRQGLRQGQSQGKEQEQGWEHRERGERGRGSVRGSVRGSGEVLYTGRVSHRAYTPPEVLQVGTT